MIRVYSMEDCPYCNEIKKMLVKEGIKFVDVDINKKENIEEADKVFAITKCDSVPIIKVGNQLLAPDISFTSINEAFTLTKRFLNGGINPTGQVL